MSQLTKLKLLLTYFNYVLSACIDFQDFCFAIALLVHFFYLAAFFIMLAEGIQLFVTFVYVFRQRRYRDTYILVGLAWGKPA